MLVTGPACDRQGQHGVTIGRLDESLRLGAPPSIPAFMREIQDEEDAARERGVLQVAERVTRDVVDGEMRSRFVSNSDSVTRRLAAVRHAHQAADAMRLEALDEPEARARLETLRDGVPPIEGLFVDAAPLVTPAEARESAWRRGESA